MVPDTASVRSPRFFHGLGFRLAALTTGLVLASMLALGTTVVFLVKTSLERHARAGIQQEAASTGGAE